MEKSLQLTSFFFIFLSFINTNFGQINKNSPSIEKEGQIDELFSDWNHPATPGAVVMVVHKGKIIFQKGYGLANLEYGIANNPETTLYHIASVSKQITVFALMLLVQEGKISLEDDIRRYLPEIHDFGETITLRHLATHTSGLPEELNLLLLSGTRLEDVITQDHILKLVFRQKKLNFMPGDKHSYCNTGFTLLAEIVERVSNQSYASFVQERILDPLEMNNSLMLDDYQKIIKNRAYSYLRKEDNSFQKGISNYTSYGPHGLLTTAGDFAKWAANFNALNIGNAELIAEMNTRAVLNSGRTVDAAMGQFLGYFNGVANYWHAGKDEGFVSYFLRFPKQDFAVAVFGNCDAVPTTHLALDVVDVFWKDFFQDTQSEEHHSNDQREEKKIVQQNYMTLSTEKLKKFCGKYWDSEDYFSREIVLKNDSLRYVRTNGRTSTLLPIGNFEFEMMGTNGAVIATFVNKKKGKYEMNLDVNGRSYKFIPFDTESASLSEYTGKYYCETLETVFTVSQKEDNLILSHISAKDVTLQTIREEIFFSDKFYIGQISFQRDNNQISGFTLSNSGTRHIEFVKWE